MQLNVRDPYFIYSANIVQNNVQARPLPVRPRTIYCSSIPSFDAEGCEGGALCRWGWGRALHSALHTTSPWPRLHCTLDTVYWSHQHSASAKRERELSPLPGCSSLLSPVAEMWRWRRHLVRARPPTSDTPQPQPHYLFTLDHTSLMTSPGLSIRQTDISGGPICIVSGAPCVMSHDQAGPEAFLVTKYTTERWAGAAPPGLSVCPRPGPGSLVSKYDRRRMLKLSQAASAPAPLTVHPPLPASLIQVHTK